ncbi:unnamed protein product [Linum tenue]|uniref:Uncharacterized protein n=1 Tax=Linum tenue TaxID=586396 RepID=A0AAV0GZF0_9ROSI|nr:unnamed protein product [Linum tenue]CAI0377773.1 unnamed protein product [Linum tenue]
MSSRQTLGQSENRSVSGRETVMGSKLYKLQVQEARTSGC